MAIKWTGRKDGRDQTACNDAKTKYNAEHYQQLKIYVRDGGREVIHQLAAAAGMSTAEYVRHCIIKDAAMRGIDVNAALGGGGITSTMIAIAKQMTGDWIL